MKESMTPILAKHDIYSLACYYYAYSSIYKGCFTTPMCGGRSSLYIV